MSSPHRAVLSHLSWSVLLSCLISGCAVPDFNFRDSAAGFAGIAQSSARDRCDNKIGYSDYRDCTNTVNSQYDAWRSQQKKSGELDMFKKPAASP